MKRLYFGPAERGQLGLVHQRVGVREARDARLVALRGGGGVAEGVPQVPVPQPLQSQGFMQAPRRVFRGRQRELRGSAAEGGARQLGLVGVQVGDGGRGGAGGGEGGVVRREQDGILGMLLQRDEGSARFGSGDFDPAQLRLGPSEDHGAVRRRGAGEVHLGVGEAVGVGRRRRRRGAGGGPVLPDPACGLVQGVLNLHPLLLAPDIVHQHLVVAATAAGAAVAHGQAHLGLVHGAVGVPLGAAQVNVAQLAVGQRLGALVGPSPRGHPVPGGGVVREARPIQQRLGAVAAPRPGAVGAAPAVRGGALRRQRDDVGHVQAAGPLLQPVAARHV
ncbi:hypothetical protein EYF80_022451 [Liparis tanakae]|uniref:Uncharacterized protein n=1 Tax=Liparis tanakae TaxID=230148 RepID=A0A4Z2HQT8_9TELE|nr:hypothetical protein EYF80_022451 [Liparis tanakae]